MHRHLTLLAGLILAGLAPLPCLAQLADLTVRVVGASTAGGTVEISLFNSAETFMREPFLQQAGRSVEGGGYEVRFSAIPTGSYAIVAVHDENGNGKLDSGLFGIGAEGYGFSNGARPLFGWPDFKDAVFTLEADAAIEIRLE